MFKPLFPLTRCFSPLCCLSWPSVCFCFLHRSTFNGYFPVCLFFSSALGLFVDCCSHVSFPGAPDARETRHSRKTGPQHDPRMLTPGAFTLLQAVAISLYVITSPPEIFEMTAIQPGNAPPINHSLTNIHFTFSKFQQIIVLRSFSNIGVCQ